MNPNLPPCPKRSTDHHPFLFWAPPIASQHRHLPWSTKQFCTHRILHVTERKETEREGRDTKTPCFPQAPQSSDEQPHPTPPKYYHHPHMEFE